MDDFTARQRFAVGEAPRWGDELLMGHQGQGQRRVPACPLLCRQCGGALPLRLGALRQRHDGSSRRQPLGFCWPDQPHQAFALPPTLAAKAAHQLGELVLAGLRLHLQG